MSVVDDIIKALQGKKTVQETSLLIDQLLKEKELYENLKSMGLSLTPTEATERARLKPEGIMNLIEKVNLIDLIEKINLIALISEITHIGTIDTISSINSMTFLNKIEQLNPDPPIFLSDFASGNFSEWTTIDDTPTIDTLVKYNDNYSMKVVTDLFDACGVGKNLTGLLPSVYYVEAHVRIDAITLPEYFDLWKDCAHILGLSQDGSTAYGNFFAIRKIGGAYKLGIWSDYEPSWVNSGVTLSLGIFYKIVLKITKGAYPNGRVDLYVNDSLVASLTTLTGTLDEKLWTGGGGVYASGLGNITMWIDAIRVEAEGAGNAVIDIVKEIVKMPSVQLKHAGVDIDPRSIRVLTASDIVDISNRVARDLGQVSLGVSTGKTNVMKTGNLVTTATTADQVILTYTVTTGKTFYMTYMTVTARLTTYAVTTTLFGTTSLENPSGTKLITTDIAHAGVVNPPFSIFFSEPIPIPSATIIRIVCTPDATTSMTWKANFGGYEK